MKSLLYTADTRLSKPIYRIKRLFSGGLSRRFSGNLSRENSIKLPANCILHGANFLTSAVSSKLHPFFR